MRDSGWRRWRSGRWSWPRRREVDEHALDVAHPALLQAGEAVGDDLRKHRHHALRQIDAGAALAGLAVEGAAGWGEVADVGDVDAELPVLASRGRCVSETASSKSRASTGSMVTISSLVKSSRPSRSSSSKAAAAWRASCQGVLGKLVRQAEGADDRQRVDAGLAARTEDLGDDALAAVLGRREAQHLDDDLVFRLRSLGAGVADVDAVAEDRAVDADVALPLALEIGADELPRGPLEDVARLCPVGPRSGPVGLAGDADEDGVAGGGVERVALGDEDFRTDLALDDVGPDEAEAGRGAAIDARDRAVRRGRANRCGSCRARCGPC